MLPREFYSKDTVNVAKDLLGKRIIRKIRGVELSGIITETEAYKHKDDPASHAFTKITERNKVMFGEVGIAYVYFTYGMHYCFNIVAKHPKTAAGAVLIRGIEPERGIEMMQKNRKRITLENLTDGPAKLAQALEITKKQYGLDLTKKSDLYITEGIEKPKGIDAASRIGIRDAKDKLWNFKIKIRKEG
ncbi:DNA-3-methyladenine glycosylase [Nitrosopumilus sp.]|uniref:DNA-3-methyladenine glycosylase n=1 Tax=Nitrosopumilus sp. TaxID=2024843 RepID=UPI00292E6C48|nr:DNA-3-methyladenine glycosylase [Nitrosopumilus sp.]